MKTNSPVGCRPYTPLELAADRLIHLVGMSSGTVAATALVAIAAIAADGGAVAATIPYAIGLLAMLGCSAAYNLAPPSPRREILRRFDHAAIFLMIAGTYTPFTTLSLKGVWSIALTGVVWTVAAFGAVMKLAFPRRLEGWSTALYLALGWIALVALKPLTASLDPAALLLLGAGGVLYSVGTGFHLWQALPFQNAIWHGFVLAAAGCHYAAILLGMTQR